MRGTRGISSWDGTATTPIAVAIGAGLGVAAATTWTARGGAHEDTMVTRIPALVRVLHPIVVGAASTAVAALSAALVYGNAGRVVVSVRAVLLWSALAFIGAALGRAQLAWVGPAVYFLFLGTVGYHSDGTPLWWNVPMLPPADIGAWALTLGVVTMAAVAIRVRTG
ncbi:hypothetical protein [Xylanimonas oleitrophica]|nr:hypothetical protein [Xylanimonas oleitrophica]